MERDGYGAQMKDLPGNMCGASGLRAGREGKIREKHLSMSKGRGGNHWWPNEDMEF